MKTVVISGSAKLREPIAYWRGYFTGTGHEILDYPTPEETPDALLAAYQRFYRHLDEADIHFIMNENKNGIKGYIGPNTFAELTHSLVNNLNHNHHTKIVLLQLPDASQNYAEEINFWLERDEIKLFNKAPLTTVGARPASLSESVPEPTPRFSLLDKFLPHPATKIPRARCLRHLTETQREYLDILSSDFPDWLLKYISAPEFQRLAGVSNACVDHCGLFNFQNFNSVFAHSIGVALIVWNFTNDKKQTLAALFHDIASPSFKHCIDFLNGDDETQESTEGRTAEIIRNSKVITRQLKRDEILPSEVSDYHLYPIADNDLPGLAADRLEYTFSNGLFLYHNFDLPKVKEYYSHLRVLKNEQNLDELGFDNVKIAADFVTTTLPLFAEYHSDAARVAMQFVADVLKSMFTSNLLSPDDLYLMSEAEIVDWILNCGDEILMTAFQNFQSATTLYSSTTAKKDRYSTSARGKIRYTVPLAEQDGAAKRITALSPTTKKAVDAYLAQKLPKFVGFDFDFTPYS